MKSTMSKAISLWTSAILLAAMPLVVGCGGSTSASSSSTPTGGADGAVSMMVSDAPVNDWSTIAVRVASIALNPQGGGTPVTVYTAPTTPAPLVNLTQLDQLGELFDNAMVPVGTYTSATLTLSANPGDVVLIASEDPDSGFAWTAGQQVPQGQIQIQGATGSSGSKTVPLTVNFVSNLVVSANQNNQLDLEFDLAHPAFIVAHVQPSAAQTMFAVNFKGPVHHHLIRNITSFVLRDLYGTVSSVNSTGGLTDNSITMFKDHPAEPPTNPETQTTSTHALTIQADATNGTLFYNLDASPIAPTTIFNFQSVASLLTSGTEYLRVTARYQVDGTLVAVRVYASSSFNTVFVSPEGHVLHVNTATNILSVANEVGSDVKLQVNSATQFFFRTPASAQSDATAIGTGTAFLSNVKRGFKVHVTANPLTTPMTALTVDIETARFDGTISNSTTTGFDYTRVFNNAVDDYTNFLVNFIPNTAANGKDPMTGAAISGFKWWNFSFPTLVTSNVTDTSTVQTILDFDSTTNESVNFGGSIGTLPVYGQSGAIWAAGAPGSWEVPSAILVPGPLPLASVSGSWVTTSGGGDFTIVAPPHGTTPAVTIDVSSVVGSATLIYQVDRTNGIVTISPVDITTPAGLSTVTNNLVTGTLVAAAGVPEPNGHLKAYIILYYTGTMPTATPAT